MKRLITATLLLAMAGTTAAASSSVKTNRFTEYANVVNVRPVYREVSYRQPRKECWIEEEQHVIRYEGSANKMSSGTASRTHRRSRSGGDVLIGGIIGGVIGNQLGRHSGSGSRNGATVVGAIIGSALASEAGSRNARHRREQPHQQTHQRIPVYSTRPVEHCKNIVETQYEQRLQGYDVTYEYRGQSFTTRMNRDPGQQLELQVTVRPARQ